MVTRADGEHIRDAQQCYNIEQAIRQRLDQTLNPQNRNATAVSNDRLAHLQPTL